ncbi:LPXTG cell wall anchor domain-containing protein [Enterococcus sp. AZ196]|uniref:LPXTG cell wall anchor domain-containing protein n=1 Tax=Enterococcus sp. AZ196 TaxID=2774659 RepID=UPI003D2DDBCD
MKRIGTIFLLVLLPLFAVVQPSFAQEKETTVGIGFVKTTNDSPKNEPINQVLPKTDNAVHATEWTPAKRLPQTGSVLSRWMQILGSLCLMLVFWLFLYVILKEEESITDV